MVRETKREVRNTEHERDEGKGGSSLGADHSQPLLKQVVDKGSLKTSCGMRCESGFQRRAHRCHIDC